MAWQPQDEPLRQLAQCLRDSLSGHDDNARKNAGEMLKSAQSSPDIDKYLAYIFSSSQPPPVVNMDAAQYFQTRAAAAVMLKNEVKTTYKSMPDSTKDYIRSVILVGLQDSASQIRGYAGNVITEIVRQQSKPSLWIH